ncbi:hypothetical protein KP509_03G012700 [Ceratopteris richardii]|uniref:Uncharacterized protein n=1 Tax=Ceratopteris richardii TaxID=49495 RepID=A0A8T2UXE5_CERRI|nr:hypothetical protein KP509_03G012700 [Ceratopteris richardii]
MMPSWSRKATLDNILLSSFRSSSKDMGLQTRLSAAERTGITDPSTSHLFNVLKTWNLDCFASCIASEGPCIGIPNGAAQFSDFHDSLLPRMKRLLQRPSRNRFTVAIATWDSDSESLIHEFAIFELLLHSFLLHHLLSIAIADSQVSSPSRIQTWKRIGFLQRRFATWEYRSEGLFRKLQESYYKCVLNSLIFIHVLLVCNSAICTIYMRVTCRLINPVYQGENCKEATSACRLHSYLSPPLAFGNT